MCKRLLFTFLLVVSTSYMLAQSSAYVGETVYLNAPSVPGTIDGAAWYCTDKEKSVTVTGDHYGGKVMIDEYFTGTATIACQYAYSYMLGGKKKYGHGTAYYHLGCLKSTVTLSKSALKLNLNETAKLTYYNSSGYYLRFGKWTTSNTKVALVEDGERVFGQQTVTITPIDEGECTITFDGGTGGDPVTCNVIVKIIPPQSITLSPKSLTLKQGKTGSFKYKLSPSNAYTIVDWTSSDESVAKVSATGRVMAVGGGKAQITAKTDNGLTATGTVEVCPLPQQVSLDSQTNLTLGYATKLTPTLSPSNAISTFTWKSSDSTIVAIDGGGKIKGRKTGEATITVTTENGKEANCRIVVKQPVSGMEYRNADVRIRTLKTLIKSLTNELK